MKRYYGLVALVLLAACADNGVATPTAPTAPAVEAPAAITEVTPVTVAPYCGGEAVADFRPNLGADGYVTFVFTPIPGIHIYQAEVQSRDENGVYGRSGDWGKVIDTDNLATRREQVGPGGSRTFRARVRSFNDCGSFGAFTSWVEFGA